MSNEAPKKLKIVRGQNCHGSIGTSEYIQTLNAMLIAESNLIKAKKIKGMTHFIAIVKELERIHDFKFVALEED